MKSVNNENAKFEQKFYRLILFDEISNKQKCVKTLRYELSKTKETVVPSSNLFQGIGMKVSIKKKKKIIKKTHKES